MTQKLTVPNSLKKMESFTRKEFNRTMKNEYGLSEQQSKYALHIKLDIGEIIHMGWDKYTVAQKKELYTHNYSNEANDIAKTIEEKYCDLDFQLFEMIQLNQFMNHLVAHNTIFVWVENDLVDFVFDTLNKEYPGRVMLKPSLDMYYRYLQENEIVVGRLPSETPKGFHKPWQSRIEKILVDILVDKLIGRIVPDGEKATIIEGAYKDFLIDEATMIRYAKRKGAGEKIVHALHEYGRVLQV